MALACLGRAECGLGRLPRAQQYLQEALRCGAEIGAFAPTIFSLSLASLLLADQHEVKRAVELYGLAASYPYVANSRFFEDVFGRHINAVAAALPPDVAEAARERGRARDLEATVKELLAELEA